MSIVPRIFEIDENIGDCCDGGQQMPRAGASNDADLAHLATVNAEKGDVVAGEQQTPRACASNGAVPAHLATVNALKSDVVGEEHQMPRAGASNDADLAHLENVNAEKGDVVDGERQTPRACATYGAGSAHLVIVNALESEVVGEEHRMSRARAPNEAASPQSVANTARTAAAIAGKIDVVGSKKSNARDRKRSKGVSKRKANRTVTIWPSGTFCGKKNSELFIFLFPSGFCYDETFPYSDPPRQILDRGIWYQRSSSCDSQRLSLGIRHRSIGTGSLTWSSSISCIGTNRTVRNSRE